VGNSARNDGKEERELTQGKEFLGTNRNAFFSKAVRPLAATAVLIPGQFLAPHRLDDSGTHPRAR
jgi:hypothetical protein